MMLLKLSEVGNKVLYLKGKNLNISIDEKMNAYLSKKITDFTVYRLLKLYKYLMPISFQVKQYVYACVTRLGREGQSPI